MHKYIILIAHNLRIKTGRWSRLPREERLCPCGEIQTERHIIENCRLSQEVRLKFSLDFRCETIMNCINVNAANAVYETITIFE